MTYCGNFLVLASQSSTWPQWLIAVALITAFYVFEFVELTFKIVLKGAKPSIAIWTLLILLIEKCNVYVSVNGMYMRWNLKANYTYVTSCRFNICILALLGRFFVHNFVAICESIPIFTLDLLNEDDVFIECRLYPGYWYLCIFLERPWSFLLYLILWRFVQPFPF